MTTSTNIHGVTSVVAGNVTHSNSNAITLTFNVKDYRGEYRHELTLFGLPTETADYISEAFSGNPPRFRDAAIRADERAKVIARLATLIGEAA